jgi:hypothetical protein
MVAIILEQIFHKLQEKLHRIPSRSPNYEIPQDEMEITNPTPDVILSAIRQGDTTSLEALRLRWQRTKPPDQKSPEFHTYQLIDQGLAVYHATLHQRTFDDSSSYRQPANALSRAIGLLRDQTDKFLSSSILIDTHFDTLIPQLLQNAPGSVYDQYQYLKLYGSLQRAHEKYANKTLADDPLNQMFARVDFQGQVFDTTLDLIQRKQ